MSTILISGTAKWAKVRPDQKVKSYDEKYEEYTLDLYPDDKGWLDFKRSGLQIKDKMDADGAKFIKPRRKYEEMNWKTGEMQVNGAPKIFFKDAQSGEFVVDTSDVRIGNGSQVTVAIEVYKTKNGNGHRLLRVFVDNLIVFEPRVNEADAPNEAKLPF